MKARRDQPPPKTHATEWDAPSSRGVVRAFCGAYIRKTDHTNEPTCAECATVLAWKNAQRIE